LECDWRGRTLALPKIDAGGKTQRMTKDASATGNQASRRAFLQAGLAGAAAVVNGPALSAAATPNAANLPPNVPEWTRRLGKGVTDYGYGSPAKYESHIRRRTVPWLTATTQSSVSFTPLHEIDGIITRNGLCFERHHSGIAEIDPIDYRLMIHGLVDKPLIFTLDHIKRLPRINRIYFCECTANSGMEWRGAQMNGCQFTHGMVHCVMYTGVPLRVLLNEAGLKPKAKWLLLEGADAAAMSRSLPLKKALDDALVAYRMNGEMLYPENGYPVRLVLPGWEANMWVKWLRRIEVGDQPWHTREETSKYTDLLPGGKARRFTYVMDAKSVITNPSPQAPINHKSGFTMLSGIAWSGRGKIARVDVSLDGGRNWRQAAIDGPVLDKALTRFYYEFNWDGSELLLQSRAMDETRYVQPRKSELRKYRGVNSIYHNNGIQTWHLRKNGELENVEVS
jgi:sulfane dehydrogenase subunit SoxC